MALKHGRTHPHRDPSANHGRPYVNDGRAPDTMLKLVGKKPLPKQRKEAKITLNETFGSIYFTWKENSCWLDVSLTLLDQALTRGWEDFEDVCSSALEVEGLGSIFASIQRIRGLKSSPEQDSCLSEPLNLQRDLVRESLLKESLIRDLHSPDMVFVSPLCHSSLGKSLTVKSRLGYRRSFVDFVWPSQHRAMGA
jgi:hypothetical protein